MNKMTDEEISYQRIISRIRKLQENELFEKKPEIVFVSEYRYNQTIVVRGNKEDYQDLTEFWVSFLSWFDEDEIIYEDFSKFSSKEHFERALSNRERMGVCEEVNLTNIHFHGDNFLKYIDDKTVGRSYLMNPIWNSKKLLATTDNYYYGYNWWTGE